MSVDMGLTNYFTIGANGKIDKSASTAVINDFYGNVKEIITKLNIDFWDAINQKFTKEEFIEYIENELYDIEGIPLFYNSQEFKEHKINYSAQREMSDEDLKVYEKHIEKIKKEFLDKRVVDLDLIKKQINKIIDEANDEDDANRGLCKIFEDDDIKNRDGQWVLSNGGYVY